MAVDNNQGIMAATQPSNAASVREADESISVAKNGEAKSTRRSTPMLGHLLDVSSDSPKKSGPLLENQSSVIATRTRLSYSSMVEKGSRGASPTDAEVLEAFARLPLRLLNRQGDRKPITGTDSEIKNRKSQMSHERRKRLDGTEGKWRKGSMKSSSAAKSATIKTAQNKCLKISFDDVCELPISAWYAAVSLDDASKRSSLAAENPEYFVPPKWFPKTSVLYQMYSKPKLPCVQIPSKPGSPHSHYGVGMTANNLLQLEQFPLVHIIPASCVLQQEKNNSLSANVDYPSECTTKTAEDAIQAAFLAHYARQRKQSETELSHKAPSASVPLRNESKNPADNFNASHELSTYHCTEPGQKPSNASIPKSPKTSHVSSFNPQINSKDPQNFCTCEVFDGSECAECELSAIQRLMRFTLFGRRKASKCAEKRVIEKETEQGNGFESDSSNNSIEDRSSDDENGLSEWEQDGQCNQICDSCRYWEKLKAENPSVDISEQVSQRLRAFKKQGQLESFGQRFNRCAQCNRKLTKGIAALLREKQIWDKKYAQRSAR